MEKFIERMLKIFNRVYWLERKREKLLENLDKTEKEIEEIENTKKCDVCGKKFKAIIVKSNSEIFGGATFYSGDFPPIYNNKNKLIVNVCAHCIIQQMEKEKV